MSDSWKPGDRGYTVLTPGVDALEAVVVEAAAKAAVEVFRGLADIAQEKVRAEYAEAAARREIEKFRLEMDKLGRSIDGDHERDSERQRFWFATAHRMMAMGETDNAIRVLEMMSKEGRPSLVQTLIEYQREARRKAHGDML